MSEINFQSEMTEILDELKARVKDWEGKELIASNNRLYEILQQCYQIAEAMAGSDKEHEDLKKLFLTYCEASGYVFKDSTSLVQRVVRVVFCSADEADWNRSRISTYGRALSVLLDQKVSPDDFIEVVKKAGGIEEIKKQASAEESKDYVAIGKKVIKIKSNIATVTSQAITLELDAKNKNSDTVIFVASREGHSSTWNIRGVIQNESVLKSALSSIGKKYPTVDPNEEPEEAQEKGELKINLSELPKGSDREAVITHMTSAMAQSAGSKVPEPA